MGRIRFLNQAHRSKNEITPGTRIALPRNATDIESIYAVQMRKSRCLNPRAFEADVYAYVAVARNGHLSVCKFRISAV